MLTNWNEIFESSSYDEIRDFVNGEMTGRQFSNICSEARRLVRLAGVDNARERARLALRRRNVSPAMM